MSRLAERMLGGKGDDKPKKEESDPIPSSPPRDVVRVGSYLIQWKGEFLHCTCPGFKYSKSKMCKHIQHLTDKGALPEKPVSRLAESMLEVSSRDVEAETRDTLDTFPLIEDSLSVFPISASGFCSGMRQVTIHFNRSAITRVDNQNAESSVTSVRRILSISPDERLVSIAWSSGGKAGETVLPAESKIEMRMFRNNLWQLTIMGSGGQLMIQGNPCTFHLHDGSSMTFEEWIQWKTKQ